MLVFRFFGACAALLVAAHPSRATFTFEDIDSWTGQGSDEAALVVDWISPADGTSQNLSLAWGFRFDGASTGLEMMNAIAAADPRFSFTAQTFSFGTLVQDLAYDPGLDGSAEYFWPGYDAGTGAYWNQWVADGVDPYDGGSWTFGSGIANHSLSNGSWSGWRYGNDVSPRLPQAVMAVPEPGGLGMALMGCGLLVAGWWRTRRRG